MKTLKGFKITWINLFIIALVTLLNSPPSTSSHTSMERSDEPQPIANTTTDIIDSNDGVLQLQQQRIEIRTIHEIMKRLNQSYLIRSHEPFMPSKRGHERRIPTGIFIGGWSIADSAPDVHFVASPIFDFDKFVWCVSHAKSMPKWVNFIKVFNKPIMVFYFFIMFYFFVTWAFFYVEIYEGWNYDYHRYTMYVVQATLSQPLPLNPRSNVTRAVLLFLWFMCMVYVTTLVAVYIVIIHKNYEYYQIQSIAELIEGRFQLAGNAMTRAAVAEVGSVRTIIVRSWSK